MNMHDEYELISGIFKQNVRIVEEVKASKKTQSVGSRKQSDLIFLFPDVLIFNVFSPGKVTISRYHHTSTCLELFHVGKYVEAYPKTREVKQV